MEDDSSSVWSEKRFYLTAFSYAIGPMISRLTSPMLIRSKVGILILLPIHFFLMFVITLPCVYMELALGQYSSKTLVKIWDLCPILRGIGYCSFVTLIIYQMYNVFLTNANLFFAILTMAQAGEASWKSCTNKWNEINCFTMETNFTRRSECAQRWTEEECENMEWQSSVVQFFFYRVLNIGTKSANAVNYELLLCALVTMMIIFLANYSGPNSTEKFLIFLMIVPSVQVAILFLSPLLGGKGYTSLVYLFRENEPSRLKDINIWITIMKMVSSDCGLGFGGYMTLGTRRSFRSPIRFKSIIISFLIFSFTTIYSITIQNYMSNNMAEHAMYKEEFLSLEGELNMPEAAFFLTFSSRFWTTMWLTNIYMVGLRNLIAMMCLTTEIIYNSFPQLRTRHTLLAFLLSCLIYLGVVIFSTRTGYYLYKVLDLVLVEVGLVLINTFRVFGVVYCYGINNFLNDLHFMLGNRLSLLWKTFYVVNPLLFGTVLVRNLRLFYEGARRQPFVWLTAFKQFLLWIDLAVIVIYAIYYASRNIAKKQYKFIEPSKEWGPKDPLLQKSREMFTAHSLTKEYVYRQARFGTHT